jgi:hypothetical protein
MARKRSVAGVLLNEKVESPGSLRLQNYPPNISLDLQLWSRSQHLIFKRENSAE